jgi:hypothetical protein
MKSILLLSLIAVSGACVDQIDDDGLDETTTSNVPRLAVNGMGPNQTQYTNLDAAPLTGSAISSLTATADGRAYLQYVVSCALDATQSVSANGYTFTGIYGMQTGWTTSALTLSQRRWISACVLARTNILSTSMTISMRGTHAALATVPSELTSYNRQEGTFYGDIFGGNTVRRACADADTLNGVLVGVKARKCAFQPDPYDPSTSCSFFYDGACSAHCTVSGDGYSSCTDNVGAAWTEVIKVNLL